MNTILLSLSILGGLIVLLLIIGLFSKKGYSVYRNIIINRPKSEVFDYIRHLKNQDFYNKWVMKDPDMKKEYRGTDGTVGFVYAWNGNREAGEGEQEIMKIKEGERIDVEVRFIRPFSAIANGPYITESTADDKTNLSWGMNSQLKYPMNIMLLFMNFDKLLGADLELNLNNLKNILENKGVN
ncbi:MAG TPA: SRPBCC family protein [Saprospiraceae bacterium]|nr:SRPBCC family protein [Saprospiraceae bacterium]